MSNKGKITEKLVAHIRDYLGEEGAIHFREVYERNGSVFGIVPGAGFPVHTHTLGGGMSVRNEMRRSGLCDDWNDHDLDNNWALVVERALGLEESEEAITHSFEQDRS